MDAIDRKFVAEGAKSPLHRRDEIEQLKVSAARYESDFHQAVTDASQELRFDVTDEKQLQGLPSALVAEARERAKQENAAAPYRFALVGSAYINVMTEAEDRELRKSFFTEARRASPNIGAYSTETTLQSDEATSKSLQAARSLAWERKKRAEILGFASFADYVTARQVAGSVPEVESFLRKILERARPKAEKEWEELSALAKADGIEKLEPWDVMFYRNRALSNFLQIDSDELNEYLDLNQMLPRVLEEIRNIFGLDFVLDESLEVYHATDVKPYRVYDHNRGGVFVAHVYLDLYGRASKGGAFISAIKKRHQKNGVVMPASIAVSYNFPRPPSEAGAPNLLSLEQARTLLHELGHVVDAVKAEAAYASLSADSVAWDFVEVPSKLFENFITDPAFMARVARNYRDPSLSLKDEVLERLAKAQNFMPGLLYLSKAAYSLLDLAWHRDPPHAEESIKDFEARVLGGIFLHDFFENSTLSSTFTHIFSSPEYASLFYSYLFSQAYADVGFDRRFGQGHSLDSEVGRDFGDLLLAPAAMIPEREKFKNFIGGDFEVEDFFKHIGL
jgi:peptidyl-dipeptidase Dcp